MHRRTRRDPSRRRAAVPALAVLASTGLLLAAAPPAAAAEPAHELVGATAATAVRLTLNLPGGAATKVVLELDPVTGTVRRTASTTAATGDATVLRGRLGAESLDSGTSSARLPQPTRAGSAPGGELARALAGTPLQDLLRVELLPSSAVVDAAPSSTSQAGVARLGAGLPDDAADALAPLTAPLQAGVDGLLGALSDASATPVERLCAGATEAVEAVDPVTSGLQDALAALPVPVPAEGLLQVTVVEALCGLTTTLAELDAALQDALSSLTGDSGVLGTGAVTSTQALRRDGAALTARAEASVASLTLLGQAPFAAGDVLRTASTARAAGAPGTAQADVASSVAALRGGTVDPFAAVRLTVEGIRDGFVGEGELPQELRTLLTDLFATLDAALAPVGVTVFALDASPGAAGLAACPRRLDPAATGTFRAPDGRCAAAATRGVGIAVSLPPQLATPLQVAGPLVELQVVPTAAAVQVRPVTAPVAARATLPRTGVDGSALGAGGLVLLLAAAALRRRRTA